MNYFETKVNNSINNKKDIFATKEDIARLEKNMSALEIKIKMDVHILGNTLAAMFAFLKYFVH